jgi:guanine nucleotide-binding protein G(I)/G(S)/G(T) subunit beta-1
LQDSIAATQRQHKDGTLAQAVQRQGLTPLTSVRGPPGIKMRRALKGHFGKVTALHWGSDSKTMVSACQDGNMLIWNAITSNKLQAIPLKSSYVMAVAIEPTQGDLVACGGLDNLCTIYRRSSPRNDMEMASHDGFLSCCRFIDEQHIVTSSGDSTCMYWDIPSARPIATFAEHTADAMFLSLQPNDPNVFASCSVDQTVKIWDIRAPQTSQQTFAGHLSDVNCVEFLPSDPHCLVSCGLDHAVRLFDMRAYNQVACFGSPSPSSDDLSNDGYTCLAPSRSGRVVFCGHTDGSIAAFDMLSDKMTPAYTFSNAHERTVACLGMTPQGNALCSGSWDGLLKVWA